MRLVLRMRLLLPFLFFVIPVSLAPAQPLQHRILIATSPDGLSWTRLNRVFSDSGDVPDAVLAPNGNVHIYYQGLWTPTRDGIMVGISTDGLTNWQFYQIPIPGTGSWPGKPCDPDVIVKNDTFRLYFTGDPVGDGRPETYSAVSTDGISFAMESGIRFQVSGQMVLDPSLLWTDTLQYFAGGAPPGQNWHAHSTDGFNFSQRPNFSSGNLLMANGIRLTSGYRFYGFENLPAEGIRSLFSSDGETWAPDSGYRLRVDPSHGLESLCVKDPAVVRKDTLFLMYYVTRKPLGTGIETGRQGEKSLLNQNLRIAPNPFSLSTEIAYSLPSQRKAGLKVYNSIGRLVEVLYEGEPGAGSHLLRWERKKHPPGVYFAVLAAGGIYETRRVVLLK
jgi:hypothetical protein